MVETAQRDFNNSLDCPKCLTGGSVTVERSWQSTLNEALVHVKWSCNASPKGMKCDYRHWEQIEHPQVVESSGLVTLPVKLPPYVGRSMFGKCPRCGDENQVLHDYKQTTNTIQACVRCVTELWQLTDPQKGVLPYSASKTVILYGKPSDFLPDPQTGPQQSATVKGKVKCEMCGKFVDKVYDRFNTWVCKSCVEVCDEPDAAILASLRKGME